MVCQHSHPFVTLFINSYLAGFEFSSMLHFYPRRDR